MKNALLLVTIFSVSFFSSCKKDYPVPSSRVIKFEVTGNFTGTVFASYTTSSGGTTNEQVNLPWSKEINYASNVAAAIVALSGNGGAVGQQLTIAVKRGASQVSSTPVTVDSSGSFSVSTPVVTF